MTRLKQRRELEAKLSLLKNRRKYLDDNWLHEDGTLNQDHYNECQLIVTDIHLVKKKIGFLKREQGYLGGTIQSCNANSGIITG